MTNLLSTLTPAIGVIVGGALTLVGQALSEHRARKREIGNRREELLIRRYEIERETLLEMQSKLVSRLRMLDIYMQGTPEREDISRQVTDNEFELHMLACRCLSQESADACFEAIRKTRTLFEEMESDEGASDESVDSAEEAFRNAQKIIGSALKRDPLTSIHGSY